MKKILLALAATLLLVSCGTTNNTNEIPVQEETTQTEQTLKIVTSIVPLASITHYIGGEKVEVNNLVWAGVSPHAFDLKPQDLVNIEKSDLIVSLGLDHIDGFLEKWEKNKDVIHLSEGIKLIEGSDDHDHEHEDEDEHGHEDEHHDDHDEADENNHENEEMHADEHHDDDHDEDEHHDEHGHGKDPHIWNSLENGKIMAGKITQKLSALQPENAEYFQKNYEAFIQEADTLKKEYAQKFTTKRKTTEQKYFIIFHEAHNYLFTEFWIDGTKKIIFRKSVLSDPSSAEMKEIIDDIQLHKVDIAFTEPQFSNDNFQKLTKEYNIQTAILNPLGTSTEKNGFFENMKANLESLEKIY